MKRILIISLLFLLLGSCQNQTDYTPSSLLEFKRVKMIKGQEADEFVNRIHLRPISTDINTIAFYEADEKTAVIYHTEYEDKNRAIEDYKNMIGKISPENSAFVGGKQIQIENKTVYRCFGMGQTHYVFYHNNFLFWISLPTIGAEDHLRAYFQLNNI
ncbi:MAG: hypothetical protein JXR46_15535 [Calditrichaceae bacterium]|nr:hypothetical protein [Calditrichaceae bacterium]MBN2710456.1 hypothetical protein [Calditrichaceae bacterium]RQV93609.1 MAG: hypothetical protein EH224_12100 [Calditrichota bacterium]